MQVSINAVRAFLLVCLTVLLTYSYFYYPKLAGPFSGIGAAIQQIRSDVLGADSYQPPPLPITYQRYMGVRGMPIQTYRPCNTCLIELWLLVDPALRSRTTRIMNIVPKYEAGMLLEPGEYIVEFDYRMNDVKRTYRETVNLTRDHNIFVFSKNGSEVLRVQ